MFDQFIFVDINSKTLIGAAHSWIKPLITVEILPQPEAPCTKISFPFQDRDSYEWGSFKASRFQVRSASVGETVKKPRVKSVMGGWLSVNVKIIVSQNACDVQQDHYWIIADDINSIREVIKAWSNSSSVDRIISTGGTGFGQRDVTPEVRTEISLTNIWGSYKNLNFSPPPPVERHASGLVHLLLSSLLQYTPLGFITAFSRHWEH